MTIELPAGVELLSEPARQRLVEQVNAFAVRAVREMLDNTPDAEAVAAIRSALDEDPSEEMSLEDFAIQCGVRL